jgi:predicted ArsR family transcriptional regulator
MYNGLMHELTSEKIYNYIRSHPKVTANELSKLLMLTKADIRYHLARLIKLGLITKKEISFRQGAGRPGYYYAIAIEDLISGYPLLARVCLNVMTNERDRSNLMPLSQKAAEEISRNFGGSQKSGAELISAAIQFLNQLGYQATWEARPAHPIVLLKKCPYLDLAATQPMLCMMDTSLLENITGWTPTLQQNMNNPSNPTPYCLFSLSKSMNN